MPRSRLTARERQRRRSPASRPTVLVTGGSGGIGRAICLEFGRAGWHVGVHYHRQRAEAERTVSELASLGAEGLPLQADVRSSHKVAGMIRSLIERWHGLDVLVCSAGQGSGQLVLRMAPAEWDATIHTNLTGTFHCLRAAAKHMLARRRGSVIVVGSFAGVQGRAGQAAYAASKAGLFALVKTAAWEWGNKNVRVNAVLPGWHPTALAGEAMPKASSLHDHALRRTPDLTEVARSVFQLSQLNDVSGQIWNLDSRIM